MIGLWGSDPYWQALLGQEGVSFDTGAAASALQCRALILDSVPDETGAKRIREYVEAGGCLLTSAPQAGALWPELKARRQHLRWIAPTDDSPLFRNVGIVDLEADSWSVPNANVGRTDRGRPALLATRKGDGWVVVLPFELGTVLDRSDSGPKQFYARTPRFPYDTVSGVGRGEVRRLVANCLRFLLARKGLPYVHLSYVPGDSGSVFGFRVDTDFGPLEHLQATRDLARKVGMRFSWFVNVGAHGKYLETFAGYARDGQDIQLHCYRHAVHRDYETNLADFGRGVRAMADSGLKPVGVVAPYGEWNPELDRAFADLGLEYSSEFCISYDDLPGGLIIGGQPTRIPQVPVHPICIGRLVAARADRRGIVDYFKQVIDLQVSRLEPCLLYDHPERISEYGAELADVLSYGTERCGASTTLTELACWWRGRQAARFRVDASATHLEVAAGDGPEVVLVIEWKGKYARVPLHTTRVDLGGLAWESLPEPARFEPECLATRKPGWRFRCSSQARRIRKYLQGRRG